MKYQNQNSTKLHHDGRTQAQATFFPFALVRYENTSIDANLRDVGFGISQVLPIVMQKRLSEKKTLLIEQPEIHLHPAHQAELGDMFIQVCQGTG